MVSFKKRPSSDTAFSGASLCARRKGKADGHALDDVSSGRDRSHARTSSAEACRPITTAGAAIVRDLGDSSDGRQTRHASVEGRGSV